MLLLLLVVLGLQTRVDASEMLRLLHLSSGHVKEIPFRGLQDSLRERRHERALVELVRSPRQDVGPREVGRSRCYAALPLQYRMAIVFPGYATTVLGR